MKKKKERRWRLRPLKQKHAGSNISKLCESYLNKNLKMEEVAA